MHAFAFVLLTATTLVACHPASERPETSTAVLTSAATSQDTTGKVVRTDAEWKAILTPQQYNVLRKKGTDMPFTGKYTNTREKGTYYCSGCGQALFSSDMKFPSECGWPSFDRELAGDRITTIVDRTHGMVRTEILCARCGSHLGHLFDDGPTITGQRYCVNSTSLEFRKADEAKDKEAAPMKKP
ncbi:peptide-methionine (R)-S-oxide reductase MsrB [Parachryseolinea silvisoli]|uniref:peptide-methionine (R)-S-oxide reductase MsrB n=1 Tax=Parachryseolinea silvisoli TaxID=2873601 RepID=UPI002265DB43|nr:peptide-methionine (R)-S-oxide reductase MsrB [Parachryseolinea silvisoli]MCD9013896.1 peptide-methionine (R)-S-oxide reductase MsrB [Parachryseolinea silvisoli]